MKGAPNKSVAFWAAANAWKRLPLVRQFALAALPLIAAGYIITGIWIAHRVKIAVLDGEAAAIALMVDSGVTPLAQELIDRQELSAQTRERLGALVTSLIASRVVLFKLWRPEGTVAFSTKAELIGQTFVVSPEFRQALGGRIVSAYEPSRHQSDYRDLRPPGVPVLEVYAPVRADASGEVIGIAEYYIAEQQLLLQVRNAVTWSWLLLTALTVPITVALLAIVRAGSRTIDRQRLDLERQIEDLRRLSEHNGSLHEQVSRAQLRSATINERVLRRIGADLHDGPAQLLSYALLLIHAIDGSGGDPRREETALRVQQALSDALRDIRAISAGLILPEISSAMLAEVVSLAIQMHTSLTGTKVTSTIALPAVAVPDRLKVCTYRFVQEALTNAYKHAGGQGQAVRAVCEGDQIVLEVSDHGPGLPGDHSQRQSEGLGLAGLQDRIENIGGRFETRSSRLGATVSARFDLQLVWQTDAGDAGHDQLSGG